MLLLINISVSFVVVFQILIKLNYKKFKYRWTYLEFYFS